MKKATITVGISGSGKSTYASLWVSESTTTRQEINRDLIRKSFVEKDGKVWKWGNWSWKREGDVTKEVNALIQDAANNSQDIIISDTNLSASTRNNLTAQLKSFGYEVEIKEFPITLEEAWKRDAARENGVGHSVIAEQYEKWLAYKGRKKYVSDTRFTKCVLVDIDGTVAHMNGKRGAFEWEKVGLDDVDEQVKFIVNLIPETTMVIFLSGRDGVCEPETLDWLVRNGIRFDHLIMRSPNDMRKDTIVKEEIFWRDIADKYNVQFVIDDRPVVCRMWRELGLKVMQVGNPHIEF